MSGLTTFKGQLVVIVGGVLLPVHYFDLDRCLGAGTLRFR